MGLAVFQSSYLWTLKFEFSVIFMGYEIFFFFCFFPPTIKKNVKTTLSSQTIQRQAAGQIVVF